MPITTPSTATNADSTTKRRRTAAAWTPERPQHADLPAPLADGADHDHADARDADDQAEREVAADQQEELLLVGELVVHDVLRSVSAFPPFGEEPARERSAN